jgi:hypothetical protein
MTGKISSRKQAQRPVLEPLLKRIRSNGGSIYPDGPAFYLMIDFKSEAESTYAALRNFSWDYREMLTSMVVKACSTDR